MSNKETKQQVLEKTYQKQQNFFYESVSTKLKEYQLNAEKTKEILFSIESNKPLTAEQFEILGCFSYLVGIDYTNQPYLQENICGNVLKRFSEFKFDEELLNLFVISISKLTEEMITPAKDELKNKILKVIPVKTEDRLLFNNLRSAIKGIINNSIVPVNMAIGINNIIQQKDFTYEDIIKINSAINIQCKYLGKNAVKHVLKLYGDKQWMSYLHKASKLFDNQKFAVVYLDGILSTKESINKFPVFLSDIITGKYLTDGDVNFETFKTEYEEEEKLKTTISNENPDKIEVSYQRVSDELMADISANKPVEFMLNVFGDILGYYPTTTDDVFKAIDKLLLEADYVQHIYHYLKANLSKVNFGDMFGEISIHDLLAKLDEKIESLKEEYKASIELICKDIPEKNLNKIVTFLHICISDLVLQTDEQKQYLISEMMESNVRTYQQLSQIIELIENCDMLGSQIISYIILNKYLEETSEIVEVFNQSSSSQDNQLKLSLFIGFSDLFKATLAEVKEETTPIVTE